MKSARRAYFRSHRSAKVRRAFVQGQEAKLRALKRAAACRVVPPGAEVVASSPVGGTGGVGVGAGSVWVMDRTSGLLRFDPNTNMQVDVIARVFGGAPVVGEGAVWVPSGTPFYNSLLRVDPQAHTFIQIPTGPSADEWPVGVVVTPGAVWVGNHHGGPVVRVDPRTNKVVATIPWSEPTFGGIYHMATDGSTVWVTGTKTTDAAEINVATNAIVRRIDVPNGTCGGIDVDPASVWVASGYDAPYPCWQRPNWGVSRIDRSTGRVTRIDVGGRPIDVRVGLGSVWAVVDAPQLQLVRIDPRTNTIVGRLRIAGTECRTTAVAGVCPAGEATTALAVGFGSVWLRVNSTGPGTAGRLLRIDPT
jgi:streptogramin lyase